MRGVGISSLYKSRMRNNQSATKSREMENIAWRSVILSFFSLHSSQLVVKKKCDVSRGWEEFYLGGCETNKADKSSKGRGQKNRVRSSCHRSRSTTGLFVKSRTGAQGPNLPLYGINCPEP